MRQLCKATKKNGEPCQANRLKDSEYCYFHDPALAPKRALARSRGGRAKSGRVLGYVGDGAPVPLRSVRDLLAALENELGTLWAIEPSIQRAKAVSNLVSVGLRAFEVSELAERIQALEQRVNDL